MSDEVLLVDDARREGVRVLTLNRIERKNALSPDLVAALLAAVRDADADPRVRAIVLTGAGDPSDPKASFCAGGDLAGGMVGDGFLEMHEGRGGFADLLRAFRHAGTPSVAAVNGVAMGGGFGLILACDFAVASTTAKLGTPELKRGLFPMMISRLVYEQLPRRIANELVLLGERVDGVKAEAVGIVNRAVEPARVVEEALDIGERLASLSPAVMRLGRCAVYHQMDLNFDAAMIHLQDQLTHNLQTEDAAEGISAFFERRDPSWRGR